MIHHIPQIFHHYKAIFIHIPKVAGTSMERALELSRMDNVGGHSTALAIRIQYPKEFNEYYKFSFVRNPYDRISSAYFYLKNIKAGGDHQNQLVHLSKDINDYIENYLSKETIIHLWPQYKFITGPFGNILIDSIFRFENLEEDWEKVCGKLKVNLNLPHFRPTKKKLFEYTPNSINIINKLYKKDFELFGYKMI